MASVIGDGKVKLSNGQVVSAQQGGWYDGQQYWGGSLSQAGVINSQSNQQGAGQAVSKEVVQQTNPNNVAYLQKQNAQAAPTQTPQVGGGGLPGGGASIPGGGMAGAGMPQQATLNLPDLYKNLYSSSGISDLEAELSKETQGYNDAVSKINDNPFLAEASRIGRLQKLSQDFESRVANKRNDIATRKADIEMKLQLETKQYDINSQAAQQALQQFNTLLQMGALDGASGEDIANITRSTGLSSSAIMSAVNAQKQKNAPTSVIQYDDGSEMGFAVINTQTGEIINKQTVAASKSAGGGSSGGGGGGSMSESKQFDLDKKQAPSYAAQDARAGKTLKDMLQFYGQWLDPTTIYNIYNQNSRYGTAKEDKKTLRAWGITIK